MSVLEVSDLSIRFGGLQALLDVTVKVDEYEIVGLIGPNGAGKTTAFNCITGFYKPDRGHVVYRGRDVTTVPPHKKSAMGFGRTFQNVGMVKGSTVLENLKGAQHASADYDVMSGLIGTGGVRETERRLEQRSDAILELLGLTAVRDSYVAGLPYGTLKLLELGCALATEPDILLLDEPSSGMGPEESHDLGDRLIELRREFDLTMLLIEHHVPLVTRVCDYVYVLNFGQLLAEGEPSVIQTHPEVVAAYLGGEAADALEQTTAPSDQAALAEEEHSAASAPARTRAPAAKKAPAKRAAKAPASKTAKPAAKRAKKAPGGEE
jgi:branched-chain amino acid transport system ATP-binding protein